MYQLSRRSLQRLKGVHGDLTLTVFRAIQLSTTDFGISEGLRLIEVQKRYVSEGKSQTLNSKHLTGHAVDLAAFNKGAYRTEPGYYIDIAHAMIQAAGEMQASIRWGGCWMPLDQITDPQKAVTDYIDRKVAQGKKPFVDAMHYELIS